MSLPQTIALLPEHHIVPVWKHCGSKRAQSAADVCAVVIEAPGPYRPFVCVPGASTRPVRADVRLERADVVARVRSEG